MPKRHHIYFDLLRLTLALMFGSKSFKGATFPNDSMPNHASCRKLQQCYHCFSLHM